MSRIRPHVAVVLVGLAYLYARGGPLPAQPAPPRTDAHGDPLPPGAVARLGTVRLRHGGTVQGLAFSPDGKTLASSGDDHAVRLWDVATGREVLVLDDPRDASANLTFTPDGCVLVKSGAGHTRGWDARTGKLLYAVDGHCWGLSPDGKLLATGSVREERTEAMYLRDAATGKEICRYNGHHQPVLDFAFSPDGKTAASVDQGSTLRLWEVVTGRERWYLTAVATRVYGLRCLAFSPDGKTLCHVHETGIKTWDVETGKERPALDSATAKLAGRSAFYTPDGKWLVTDSYPHGVIVWDAATGKARHVLPGTFPALAADGKTLLLNHEGVVRLHDAASGEPKGEFRARYSSLYQVTTSPDGRLLAGADASTVRLWELPSGKERLGPDLAWDRVEWVEVTADGRTVASMGAGQNEVLLWDVASGRVSGRVPSKTGRSGGLAFSADGRQLAVLEHNTAHVWDVVAGKEVRTLRAGEGPLTAAAFSPAGGSLAATSGNPYAGHRRYQKGPTEAVRWDLATGRPVRSIGQEGDGFLAVGFFGGRCLVVEQAQGGLVLWELESGRQLRELPGWFCSLSPDGKIISAMGLGLWEVATGKELFRLPGGMGRDSGFVFSPDGRLLATGRDDGKVRLWHAGSGKQVHEFSGHRGRVTVLRFADNGRLLVTAGFDTTVLAWDLRGVDARAGLPRVPDPKELPALWADLGGEATKAHSAAWALVAADDAAVRLLGKELPAASDADLAPVRKFVQELDHDDFGVREAAAEELVKLGAEAEAALRHALSGKPSAELRKRAEALLAKSGFHLSPEGVRRTRAVGVLERIGTDAARKVLETLAAGSKWAPLTHDAQDALERLGHWAPRP